MKIKVQQNYLTYKVNEEKKVVTAIENFTFAPFGTLITTIGVAKCNSSKGDSFDVEKGKKLARAKAEKKAFQLFAKEIKALHKRTKRFLETIETAINKNNEYIGHQKEYIATF